MGENLPSSFGFAKYSTDSEGIGGMLKTRVSDFRVDEESKKIKLDSKGRFTLARITLTNWDTNRFVNLMAKRLRISRNRIWFAGTKDKRAVTSQLFVIDSPQTKVANIEMKDVEIEVIGRTQRKIGFGNHKGNRFTIVVRGCAHKNGKPMSGDESLKEVEKIKMAIQEKFGVGVFPNWIGPQRFGSTRPVTALVGRHVLNGKFDLAVDTYLGYPGFEEKEEVECFRTDWRKNHSIDNSLELAPQRLGYEKEMLYYLKKNPDDWKGAFSRLPQNLQLMTIHALQSEAFNKLISSRIEKSMSLVVPEVGDVVAPLDDNGRIETDRMVVVKQNTKERISRNCLMKRLAITGFLPGSQYLKTTGNPGIIEQSVINDMTLNSIDWNVIEIPRLSTKGTRRSLTSWFDEFSVEVVSSAESQEFSERWKNGPHSKSNWHPEGACLRFRFVLPSGSYATTLMREFMHAPIFQL